MSYFVFVPLAHPRYNERQPQSIHPFPSHTYLVLEKTPCYDKGGGVAFGPNQLCLVGIFDWGSTVLHPLSSDRRLCRFLQ